MTTVTYLLTSLAIKGHGRHTPPPSTTASTSPHSQSTSSNPFQKQSSTNPWLLSSTHLRRLRRQHTATPCTVPSAKRTNLNLPSIRGRTSSSSGALRGLEISPFSLTSKSLACTYGGKLLSGWCSSVGRSGERALHSPQVLVHRMTSVVEGC